MSDKTKKLEELAKRMLKAQSYSAMHRSKEHEQLKEEAKLHGFTYLEVYQYGQNNYEALTRSKVALENATTLTAFTKAWKEKNPEGLAGSVDFQEALSDQVKRVTNFNFYE
jgi:hypothetical protein